MPASSARRASAELLSQVACQRSGTVVAASPDAQFAAKIPSLKGSDRVNGARSWLMSGGHLPCGQRLSRRAWPPVVRRMACAPFVVTYTE